VRFAAQLTAASLTNGNSRKALGGNHMSANESEKRHLGRPRSIEGRRVYESLIAAAERCITESGSGDVPALQIAQAAGTNYKMINYYFGSKEELMFIIVERTVREVSAQLKKIDATLLDKNAGNPTWRIVSTIASCAATHNASARACAHVFPVRDADLQNEFYSRLHPSIQSQLGKMIRRLIDAGVYSAQLYVPFATFTLGLALSGPSLYTFSAPLHGVTSSDLQSKAWLVHVASMLDQQFRNPQQLTDGLQFEWASPAPAERPSVSSGAIDSSVGAQAVRVCR
jgi:AcrR family transcriptional regulator